MTEEQVQILVVGDEDAVRLLTRRILLEPFTPAQLKSIVKDILIKRKSELKNYRKSH